jgi:hypothetical protein
MGSQSLSYHPAPRRPKLALPRGACDAHSMCSSRSHATLWLSGVGAVAINPVLYTNLSYDMQRALRTGGGERR